MALSKRIVRIKATVPGVIPAAMVAVGTDRSPESVRGNATRFELGLFDRAGAVHNVSNVESLNLKLQPGQMDSSGVLADKTISVLDNTLDTTTWDNGTKQHAVFELTNAEMNLAMVSGSPRTLWLVVTAIMVDATEYTLIAGNFLLHEDNNAAGPPPPENVGTPITIEQADARYLPISAGDGDANGFMTVENEDGGVELALWNETRSIYQILRITGAAGSETLTFTDIPA